MSPQTTILLKSLQTTSRCILSATSHSSLTPKRSFALYTGSQFNNTRLFNKEISFDSANATSGIPASPNADEEQTNGSLDSVEKSEQYYTPKPRQTVYSALGDDIETAGPVNRLH